MVDDVTTQVWKYVLKPEISIEMPVRAEILTVEAQRDEICMWVRVRPSAPKVKRDFVVFGTGHDIPDGIQLNFIGTAHIFGGELVFHVFENSGEIRARVD